MRPPLRALPSSLVLASMLGSAGCGGCGGGPSAGLDAGTGSDATTSTDAAICAPASSETEVESFLAEWAGAACEGLARCPTGRSFASIDECIAHSLDVSPRSGVSSIPWLAARRLAAEGRLRVDPVAAAECVARARADCASEVVWARESCRRALVPTCASPPGTACTADAECGAGQACIGYPTELPFLACGTAGAGLCSAVPSREIGETCDDAAPCRGSDVICSMGRCRLLEREAAPAAEGAPCRMLVAASPERVTYATCGAGLFCAPTGDDTSECRRVAATGERCEDALCARGLLCVDGTCEPQFAIEPGAACPSYASHCGAGFVCAVDGCREAPGTLGSACNPLDAPCVVGLSCVVSQCVAGLRERGESCGRNDECSTGCCAGDFTDLRCE